MRYLYIFLIIATFIKSYSQNSDSNNKFEYLNIDHKVYTFFYAYSIPNKYPRCNGCAISNNIPKFLKDSIPSNKEDLKIWIDNSKLDTFGRNYYGYKVYLANRTDSVYQFDVDDSNLYLRIQAIDFNNEWRYIDNIYKTKCGLSHHNIYLDSGYYWEFRMPVFEGNFKTKLRLELSKFHNGNLIFQKLYSNEIEGNINISQFYIIDRDWNIKKYFNPYSKVNTKK